MRSPGPCWNPLDLPFERSLPSTSSLLQSQANLHSPGVCVLHHSTTISKPPFPFPLFPLVCFNFLPFLLRSFLIPLPYSPCSFLPPFPNPPPHPQLFTSLF